MPGSRVGKLVMSVRCWPVRNDPTPPRSWDHQRGLGSRAPFPPCPSLSPQEGALRSSEDTAPLPTSEDKGVTSGRLSCRGACSQ